jgi:multimeric flavodoxin WrbA
MTGVTGISILGISGSPRLKATDYAVKYALEYARDTFAAETESFSVHHRKIGYCTHCDGCVRKRAGCVVNDDLQELYPLMVRADAWVLGTPVYQGQMSAQLKAVLDRCRALVATDFHALRDKVGAGIAVGGDRAGGQEPTLQSIADFYLINQMIPVGGGAFGSNIGAAIWSRDKGVEGVEADEYGLASIRRVVDRLVAVARLVRAGGDSGRADT